MEKTLVFYEGFGDSESFFFELEGDYSRFDGVLINAMPPKGMSQKKYDKLEAELTALVYTNGGLEKVVKLRAPTKDWTHFVRCGFIP